MLPRKVLKIALLCMLVQLHLSHASRRTYYVAAVEVNWNYGGSESTWPVFRKTVYREYTDGYFTRQKSHPMDLGYFGPTLIAEVGDTIVVRFKNLANISCNIIPQGVQLNIDAGNRGVRPGQQTTQTWKVPHVSSPTYDDPACVNRLYYSNVAPSSNLNAGLVGTLIICKIGWIANVDDQLHPPQVFYFAVTEEGTGGKYYHINGYGNRTFHTVSSCDQNTQTWYLSGISSTPTAFAIALENHVIQVRTSHVANVITLTSGSTEVVEFDQSRSSIAPWRFYSKINEHHLNGMIGTVKRQDCYANSIFSGWWHRLSGHHSNRGGGWNRFGSTGRSQSQESPPPIKNVRTYYIAAEEELWSYAPYEYDLFTGDKLTYKYSDSKPYYDDGPFRVGSIYMKALFVSYTDETFSRRVERNFSHGFLGPVVRIQTDETLRIVFKNLASKPFNLYLDGLRNDANEAVPPGANRTYKYVLTQSDGPSLSEELCWTRHYYSNVNPIKDVASGLLGPLLICRSGVLNHAGQQVGIDRELFLYFSTTDENLSWYIDDNIAATTLTRENRNMSFVSSPQFVESNKMAGINGFAYGNLLKLGATLGSKVSLHLLCSGTDADLHTVSIANQTFHEDFAALQYDESSPHDQTFVGNRVDLNSIEIAPGSAKTVYFSPQVSGKWPVATFNLRARRRGMEAYLTVLPNETIPRPDRPAVSADSGYVRWYYIAAVEQMWDYGRRDGGADDGSNATNTVYKKVIYEEFSDATFTQKRHKDHNLGLYGPVIKAEIGDTVKVVFNNQGCRPFSVQPKNLLFHANDSGDWVLVGDEIRTDFSRSDPEFVNRASVATGHTHTYTWRVPRSASFPGSASPSECAASYYFSATDPDRDIHSGLIGPLLICNSGVLGSQDDDVIRYDVDREYHVLLKEFDEARSWYAEENMYTRNWNVDGNNRFASLNGLTHGSMREIEMQPGERIAWHVVSMDYVPRSMFFEGDPVLTFMNSGSVTSSYVEMVSKVATKSMLPGSVTTLTMVPSSTGRWKFGDFAAESIESGMYGHYLVRPKECSNALGLESGLISEGQITSSSVYVTRARFGRQIAKWKADYGRLNRKGQINAWIPSRSDESPWIQVDLETPVRVTGIRLQGTADGHIRKYITKFKILYSIDNRQWAFYQRQGTAFDMVFQGNYFYNEAVTRTFSPHLLTRYIRLMPVEWQNQPAVRMELLGCSLEGRCEDPQGITSGDIPDDAFSASSVFVYKRSVTWEPRYGRLHYQPDTDDEGSHGHRDREHDNDDGDRRDRDGGRRRGRSGRKRGRGDGVDYAPAWGPSKNNRRQWIQVDIGRTIKVGGIVTQGVTYKRSQLFVKSFVFRYSLDGFSWNVYQDPVTGHAKIFRGNIDPVHPVTHLLQNPVVARYVRIQPWAWRGRIALRFELLGCAVGHDSNTYESVTPLPEDCIAK